jgi:hypothetical protein
MKDFRKDPEVIEKKRRSSSEHSGKRSKSVIEKEPVNRALDETRLIRDKVVEGFHQALTSFLSSSTEFAVSLEEALFDAFKQTKDHHEYCSPSYKSKYRSLLYNLKDPKNEQLRARIIEKELEPTELVHLTPADLANDELSKIISEVKERSIEQAMLADEEKDGFIKKTHKGEEVMSVFHNPAIETSLFIPQAPISPEPEIPIIVEEPAIFNEEVEKPSLLESMILLQDVASFDVIGTEIGYLRVPHNILQMMPANFHIPGRLSPIKALKYLKSMKSLGTRDIYVLRVDPKGTNPPGGIRDPDNFIQYLRNADRWAVVAHDASTAIRDIYMAPCSELAGNQEELEALALMSPGDIADALFHPDYRQSFLLFIVVSRHNFTHYNTY